MKTQKTKEFHETKRNLRSIRPPISVTRHAQTQRLHACTVSICTVSRREQASSIHNRTVTFPEVYLPEQPSQEQKPKPNFGLSTVVIVEPKSREHAGFDPTTTGSPDCLACMWRNSCKANRVETRKSLRHRGIGRAHGA
jgi:hypothetical protein